MTATSVTVGNEQQSSWDNAFDAELDDRTEGKGEHAAEEVQASEPESQVTGPGSTETKAVGQEAVPAMTKAEYDSQLAKQAEYDSQLTKLARKWTGHERKGLDIRHEIGALLNTMYGSGSRQAYGQKTMKNVAEQLKSTEAELSRMRAFARRFVSAEAMRREYPDKKTWTNVKEVLVDLNRKDKETAGKDAVAGGRVDQPEKRKEPKFSGVTVALGNVSKALSDRATGLTGAQKDKLRQELEQLAEAASRCLGLQVTLNIVAGIRKAKDTEEATLATGKNMTSSDDLSIAGMN